LRAEVRGKTSEGWESAEESVMAVSALPFFSTGSKGVDGLLGGGCRAGRLTEVFGRSNTGKTQLAMQTSLLAARRGTWTLFVDTEGSFRPERLEQMAKSRGFDLGDELQRIVYVRTDSASEQMETVRRMPSRPTTSKCGLVVVDTLTRNFSVELPGRRNLSSRQGALDIHLSEMARDAYREKRAYLLTNRVTFGAAHDVGIGGSTVEQLVHASVRLDRDAQGVRATMVTDGRSVGALMGPAGVE
jgi:DNA repair protein RadA